MHRRSLGYTLIELLVAIAIIGLLVASATIGLQRTRASSRDANRKDSVRAYQQALELTKADTGSYFVEVRAAGGCAPAQKSSVNNSTYFNPVNGVDSPGIPNANATWETIANCVGHSGYSEGRITRKGIAFAGYPTDTSIADALVKNGYLNQVRTDPLASSVNPSSQDDVTLDFYLTECNQDGTKSYTKPESKAYAVRARLENAPAVGSDVTQEQHVCGGQATHAGDFGIPQH